MPLPVQIRGGLNGPGLREEAGTSGLWKRETVWAFSIIPLRLWCKEFFAGTKSHACVVT